MIRLFVALPCPIDLEDPLLDAQRGVEGMRWVPVENLHVTLRFIGEVQRPVAEDIVAALDDVRSPAPAMTLSGVGVFDHGRSGSVWARVAPKEPLEALHRKIDRAFVRCGLEPERRAFIPHITLGRWSRGAVILDNWKDRFAGLDSKPARVDRFTLYQSTLGGEGPVYDAVADYPLHAA